MADPKISPSPDSVKKPKKVYIMDPTLHQALSKMNDEYAFVEDLAQVARIPRAPKNDKDPSCKIQIHSCNAFTNALKANYFVGTQNVSREWVKWSGRRNVHELSYDPGQPAITSDGNLNTWTPSLHAPIKGDLTPWNVYIDHLFKSDPTYRDWFIHWLAYPFQNPGTKLHTACVFWSSQTGTGKSTLGYIMKRVYGFQNFEEIGEEQLHGTFNPWAAGRQFIMGEEIKGSKSQTHADSIKSMITRQSVTVNIKNRAHFTLPDCTNYYFTSNHAEAFYLDEADRRFFVHALGGEVFSTRYYSDTLLPWLKNGGYEAIHHYLLNEVDLSRPIIGGSPNTTSPAIFNPGSAAPQTIARRAMIDVSKDEAQAWVEDLRDYPSNVLNGIQWKMATSEELYALFFEAHPRTKIPAKTFTSRLVSTLPSLRGGNRISLSSGAKKKIYLFGAPLHEYMGMSEADLVSAYEGER